MSLEAVEILRNWMHQSDDPAASVRACNSILDRAWGRPEQTMNLAGGIDINEQRAETEAL